MNEIAEIVVGQAVAVAGARSGALVLRDGEDCVTIAAVNVDSSVVDEWARFSLTAPAPAADAVRTGEPVWSSATDLAERYPGLACGAAGACCAIPLLVEDAVLGALTLGFGDDEALSQPTRTFLVATAAQCAQALARVWLGLRLIDAAQEREQTSSLLSTLMTQAPFGIAFVDRDLRYLSVNPVLAGIHGVSVEEHIGRRPEEVVPALAPHLVPVAERVFATGRAYTGDIVEPAGRSWFVSYYPVTDSTGEVFAIGALVLEGLEAATRPPAQKRSAAPSAPVPALTRHPAIPRPAPVEPRVLSAAQVSLECGPRTGRPVGTSPTSGNAASVPTGTASQGSRSSWVTSVVMVPGSPRSRTWRARWRVRSAGQEATRAPSPGPSTTRCWTAWTPSSWRHWSLVGSFRTETSCVGR